MRITCLAKRCVLVLALLAMIPATGIAGEPCMLVYTRGQTLFCYDETRYSVLTSASSQFDPGYAVGGGMLWDVAEDRIAHEAYQAPGLHAFERSLTGRNEYTTTASIANLVVDGFTSAPTQFADIIVQFIPIPSTARPEIYVNDELITGLRHVIPWIQVSTPQGNGFYSDYTELALRWYGAEAMEVIAYADRNGNRILDGPACFVSVLRDETVQTHERTWGGIKALFDDR